MGINNRLAALMARAGVRPAYRSKKQANESPFPLTRRKKCKRDQNTPDSEKMPFRRPEWDTAELLAWAWETGNTSVLAQFGIHLSQEFFEP